MEYFFSILPQDVAVIIAVTAIILILLKYLFEALKAGVEFVRSFTKK